MFTYILAYLTELPNAAKSLCYSTQFRVTGAGCLAGISTGVTTFSPGQAQSKTHYAWLDKTKVTYDGLSATNPEIYLQINTATNKPTGVGYLPADYVLLQQGTLDEKAVQPLVTTETATVDAPAPESADI